jgi:peptide/nickel transport system permease protein
MLALAVSSTVPRPTPMVPSRIQLRLPWVSIAIIGTFVLAALCAELISPASPYQQSLRARFLPPVWLDRGTWSHVLGTDALGRDVLARVIYGARASLLIGFVTVLLAALVGTLVALVSAYWRGRTDEIFVQVTDATLSVPIILVALVLAVTLGPSSQNVVISVAAILWARFARVIRGEALGIMQRDFIAQARIAGASGLRIITRHVFPNVANTLMVVFALQVGYAIVVEASLSFLGAGVPPPQPAWGSMISEGREYLNTAWWVATIPMVAICLLIFAFNVFADWLRDRLDPKFEQFK